MTDKENKEIGESIRKEIEKIENSIATLIELADSENQSDANDWFSSKESNISKDINDQALAKAKQRVIILRNVLERIHNSDFGVCSKCGTEILFARMKAVPTASRCVQC